MNSTIEQKGTNSSIKTVVLVGGGTNDFIII